MKISNRTIDFLLKSCQPYSDEEQKKRFKDLEEAGSEDDKAAIIEDLLAHNLKLAVAVGHKTASSLTYLRGDNEELLQVSLIALAKAIKMYNQDAGRFSTYAYSVIEKELRTFNAELAPFKTGQEDKKKRSLIFKASKQLEDETGRTLDFTAPEDLAVVARMTGLTDKDVFDQIVGMTVIDSLSTPLQKDGETLGDIIEDKSTSAHSALQAEAVKMGVQKLLADNLDEMEMDIVKSGFNFEGSLSRSQVCEKYRISTNRFCMLLQSILHDKLQSVAEEANLHELLEG